MCRMHLSSPTASSIALTSSAIPTGLSRNVFAEREAGTETAKVIGAELTGGAILQTAKWGLRALTARQGATKLPLSLQVLQKAQGGQAVRNLAVRTAAGNTGAARRLQFASNLAEGLASTSIATAFTDNRAEEGAGTPTCPSYGVVSRYLPLGFTNR